TAYLQIWLCSGGVHRSVLLFLGGLGQRLSRTTARRPRQGRWDGSPVPCRDRPGTRLVGADRLEGLAPELRRLEVGSRYGRVRRKRVLVRRTGQHRRLVRVGRRELAAREDFLPVLEVPRDRIDGQLAFEVDGLNSGRKLLPVLEVAHVAVARGADDH